jgi:periplasmic divalent cation tolerance protein
MKLETLSPSILMVYVTFPDAQTAHAVSQSVVEQKLAACANIMAPHQAVYWWEGVVNSSTEMAVIYKTQSHLFGQLEKAIIAQHPYDTPCIVATELGQVSVEFGLWVAASTQNSIF